MAIDKLSKSNRLLQSRRYTHDSFTDSQEAFTSVLDINANEVYVDQSLIPTSSIPYSGSAQSGLVYSANGQNVMQYYWRQPLTRSNLSTGSAQNEVWFFLNPSGSNAGIGAQLIDSTQQTNFISPKYATPSLANATTEDTTTGYLAKVFVSTAATSSGVVAGDAISVNNYTFDYKTGVLQFTSTALAPTSAQYVYVSVYQYKGRTLTDNITSVSSSIAAISASVGGGAGGSLSGRVTNLESVSASVNAYTSSNDTTNTTQNNRLSNLETTSASVNISVTNLNTYSASVSNSIQQLNLFTSSTAALGSLNAFTASAAPRLTNLETTSASVNISVTNLNTYSASVSNSIGAINVFSSSQITKDLTLATYTGSIDTKFTTLGTYTGSIDNKFTSVGASTSSLNSFTASILTALTASGVNLTANGNLTVQGNLTIAGTQTIVNSTNIQLGDNIIELNGSSVANGGIYVKDPTAPTTGTGSFLWDSTSDFWKAGLSGSEQRILVVGSMGVVSGSSQISLAGTSDYSGLFGGIGASTSSLNTFTASLSTSSNVVFNTVSASAVTSSFNIPTTAVSGSNNTKRLVFRDTTGKLELAPSASVAGDFVQWDGGSFIMSNTVDGGSF
jgi:hypothetical protein